MRVVVRLFGPLRDYVPGGGSELELDIPEGATVAQAVSALGIGVEEPWTASLGGQLVCDSEQLTEGTRLLVFPPIAGGASDASQEGGARDGSRYR